MTIEQSKSKPDNIYNLCYRDSFDPAISNPSIELVLDRSELDAGSIKDLVCFIQRAARRSAQAHHQSSSLAEKQNRLTLVLPWPQMIFTSW
jgi:hypothetical protein